VRIVLATSSLAGLGGSETYVLTVSDQLQCLGHEVWLHALTHGRGSQLAEQLGVRLAYELPDRPDVVVVQDGVVACNLAVAYPRTPQVFVAHSDLSNLQPPQLPGLTAVVVCLYDRVERRIRALPIEHEIVRLSQPVDVDRFRPIRPLRERPRVALALGNYLHGERVRILRRACERAGLELRQVGVHATATPRGRTRAGRGRRIALELGWWLGGERVARACRAFERAGVDLWRAGLLGNAPPVETVDAMNQADIVFGKARVIHEAMSCGRAAYVFDQNGGDGWVTASSYPRLVADNFGGQSGPAPIDEQRLVEDLEQYDPAMGSVNRDLMVANHAASKHTAALVQVLRRVALRESPVPGPLEELARAIRLQGRAELGVMRLVAETERLGSRVHALERELERVRAETARTGTNAR
jgi:hypothetical protein